MVQLDRPVALLDRCPACRGFWFDRTELEAVCAARGVAAGHALGRLASGERQLSTRTCPRCPDTQLALLTWRRIEIDQCPDCFGFFLDKKELPRLARTIERFHAKAERSGSQPVDVFPYDVLAEIILRVLLSPS